MRRSGKWKTLLNSEILVGDIVKIEKDSYLFWDGIFIEGAPSQRYNNEVSLEEALVSQSEKAKPFVFSHDYSHTLEPHLVLVLGVGKNTLSERENVNLLEQKINLPNIL